MGKLSVVKKPTELEISSLVEIGKRIDADLLDEFGLGGLVVRARLEAVARLRASANLLSPWKSISRALENEARAIEHLGEKRVSPFQ